MITKIYEQTIIIDGKPHTVRLEVESEEVAKRILANWEREAERIKKESNISKYIINMIEK